MSLTQSNLCRGLIVFGGCSLCLTAAQARDVQFQSTASYSEWHTAEWLVDGRISQGFNGNGAATDIYDADHIEIAMEPTHKLTLDGSLKLRRKTSIDLSGGTLEVSGQVGDKLAGSSGRLSISGDAEFKADELQLNKRNTYFTMRDQSQVHLRTLFVRGTGNSAIEFAGGSLILSGSNPIYGASFAQMDANITAPAGQFQIVHLDASLEGKTLAHKVGYDLFLIDGERIEVEADGSNVPDLNKELAGLEVNGKILQVIEGAVGGVPRQTLTVVDTTELSSVVDIPEPLSVGVWGTVMAVMAFRRRRTLAV